MRIWTGFCGPATLDGVGVQFVPMPEPLVIWHREETHNSISRRTDWRYSLAWINENKHLVTPRAYASFLTDLAQCECSARRRSEGFPRCFYEKPTDMADRPLFDVGLYVGIWLIPQRIRNRIRVGFQKRDQQLFC